jgi:phosphate transport system protein
MMQRHFEEMISGCKARLVEMGSTAEKMIEMAVTGLVERRGDMQDLVGEMEHKVNEMQIEIDEQVIGILALQHPVAADLRLVVMCSKIAGELERIGDQAVNITQNTAVVLRHPVLKPLVDIPRMAEIVRGMVGAVLDSFIRQDVGLARSVLSTDDRVDELKDQVFRELLTFMMAEPETIPRALPLILVSRNLERIGDHATNIAEEVIYAVKGRDVRHHHGMEMESGKG